MSFSPDALWKTSDLALLAAYHNVRRQHVQKEFARDTQRARLESLNANAFAAGSGGVTERRNAIRSSGARARSCVR